MHERRFRAMGTDCHVVVHGAESLLDLAQQRVDELDLAWTRFRDDSELARLNARSGRDVQVSPATLDLASCGLRGWYDTQGLFNPFLLAQVVAAGYDRDFDLLGSGPRREAAPARAMPFTASTPPVQVDRRRGTVRLSPGVSLDSGGIGKGLGADLVSADLMAAGAIGTLVSLGGDLRVRGESDHGGWRVDVTDPVLADAIAGRVDVGDGGVCTTSWTGRQWQRADGSTAHHIIDPRTGESARPRVHSVTVIAPSGWRAETLAKALFLSGPGSARRLLRRHRAGAVVVTLDGTVVQL